MSSERGNLFVVSAASGSGKTTIVERVAARVGNAERVVTCTTRRPRGEEVDGVDYHFLSTEEFERRIEAGDFLEYARVHGGRLYGNARSDVEPLLERGTDLFLVIDVQGAASVRSAMPEAVSVFVLPPSFEVLEARLRARSIAENNFDETELALRLGHAKMEVMHYAEFDYCIVNDALEGAVEALSSIVVAHRNRTDRQRKRIAQVLKSFGVEGMHV